MVTMDDTSHSVYLTDGTHSDGTARKWVGYSDKTGNGGSCKGLYLGYMGQGCVNLDTVKNVRVKCVNSVPTN
jgi:hypothetical protein